MSVRFAKKEQSIAMEIEIVARAKKISSMRPKSRRLETPAQTVCASSYCSKTGADLVNVYASSRQCVPELYTVRVQQTWAGPVLKQVQRG